MYDSITSLFPSQTVERITVLDNESYTRVYLSDGTSKVVTTPRDVWNDYNG